MSTTLEKLSAAKERRFELAKKSEEILTSVEGPLTGEKRTEWEKMHSDIKAIETDEIKPLERQHELDISLANTRSSGPLNPTPSPKPERRVVSANTFNRMLRSFGGSRHVRLTDEERSLMPDVGFDPSGRGDELNADLMDMNELAVAISEVRANPDCPTAVLARRIADSKEIRDLTTAAAPDGGATVAVDNRLTRAIEIAMLHTSELRQFITILRTETGADMPHPTTDDTSEEGEIIAEAAAVNTGDPAFGQIIFKSALLHSKVAKVSVQLMDDAAIDMAVLIGVLLGERLARGSNSYYTTGTGTNQPHGYMVAAPVGHTTASAQVASFIYDDFVRLQHSVPRPYRVGGVFALSDGAEAEMKLVKDDQNRPIWRPGLAAGDPDTILGHRYFVNTHQDDPAATKKPIAFGDFRKFVAREVRGIRTQVLRELYALNLMIGFQSFMRIDSRLLDAGSNPIKTLQMAAS